MNDQYQPQYQNPPTHKRVDNHVGHMKPSTIQRSPPPDGQPPTPSPSSPGNNRRNRRTGWAYLTSRESSPLCTLSSSASSASTISIWAGSDGVVQLLITIFLAAIVVGFIISWVSVHRRKRSDPRLPPRSPYHTDGSVLQLQNRTARGNKCLPYLRSRPWSSPWPHTSWRSYRVRSTGELPPATMCTMGTVRRETKNYTARRERLS